MMRQNPSSHTRSAHSRSGSGHASTTWQGCREDAGRLLEGVRLEPGRDGAESTDPAELLRVPDAGREPRDGADADALPPALESARTPDPRLEPALELALWPWPAGAGDDGSTRQPAPTGSTNSHAVGMVRVMPASRLPPARVCPARAHGYRAPAPEAVEPGRRSRPGVAPFPAIK